MKAQPNELPPVTRSMGLLLVLGGLVAASVSLTLGQRRQQVSSPSRPVQPSTAPSTLTEDVPVIINTELVTVMVSVTDRDGRHVSGLEKAAFTLYDDKYPQEIKFFSDSDTPISLAIIFDTSNSMEGDQFMRARTALAHFVETSHRKDEYFLIDFNDRVRLLLDGTRDHDALLAKLTYVKPHGETALYDATYLGVEKVSQGSHSRRAILLVTDGNDTCSRYKFKELQQSLEESDLVLYAIGILAFSRSEARAGRTTLKTLASVTGGKAFFPNNAAAMIEAFEQIALDLRSQYSLGYRPLDLTRESKWHRIKVEVKTPDSARLLVRSREGVYAPQ